MVIINEDLSIYVTRGDAGILPVPGKGYIFQPGDVVRLKVFEKKNCENVVLQKDAAIEEITEIAEIRLTERDTKIGEVISKPVDYWYEVELNPFTYTQTIIGYDEDGPRVFRLYPEGDDFPEPEIEPEDIPIVDTELDGTSTRPVQNQAIARAITQLSEEQKKLKKGQIYEVTPATIVATIATASAGSIIQMSPGRYSLLTLTNQYGLTRKNLHGYIALAFNNGTKNDDGTLAEEAVITTYPENLTIRGQAGVYLDGVSLTSGVLSHERTITDLTVSELPGGLTFENINFTKSACLRNAQIDGLSFIGCNFSGGNINITANSYSDIHGGDHWQGATATDRKSFMAVRAKNVIIKNCTVDAKGLSVPNTSAIYLSCVDGTTVDANTITSADYNGVQVTGLEEKGLTAFASTGKITVSNNSIKNTLNRAIRIAHLENADLNVIMNSIASGIPYANDYIRITNCANTKTFFGKGGSNPADPGTLNLYDGARIDVGSGVNVSENEFQDLIIARGTSELWTYRKWSSGLAELWYRGKFNYTYQYVALPFTLIEELGCFAKQMMKNDFDGETTDVTIYSPYTDGYTLYTKKQINGTISNNGYLDTPVYVVGRWK